MRTLEINKQPMWYALLTGKSEVLDAYGNHTGVYQLTYSSPVYYPVNMSESRGTVDAEAFGIEADYDRTFVTTDMSCPIREDSIIWYGADPTKEPHNYMVHRIANSLNGITIAIRGVDVSKDPVVSA
jgi:hypothetical protein